ncbi:MAG TPA: CHAP domain-containing protein [Gaiellaceae bacterium]|nr:CHAP domain-containing protein [Gaiellaceae bacterium]
MPNEDDRIEFPEDEETKEITQQEAEANPELGPDPSASKEGVLEQEDPGSFEEREVEAAEDLLAEQAPEDEPGGAPISNHQRRALRLALTQKGIRETPPGSNVNIYSKYFGFGAQFWCADFVAWSLDRTGNRDHKVPWGYPSAVENITRWGKRNGKIHSQPRKGDIFTRKDGKHTGWVVSSQGTGFTTIEGNTSGPDGRVIYVASHARDAASGTYFFVRHHWE